MGKRGPKSWREKAEKPRRLGMKGRMVMRHLETRSDACFKVYRGGWNAMWGSAADLLRGWGIKPPGQYKKRNLFGGNLWGSPAEFRKNPITGNRLARVLERAYEKGVTLSMLKKMRKTCSLCYMLDKGIAGKNYPVVDAMMDCLDFRKCSPKTSLVPTKIVKPAQLKQAFTKPYDPAGDLTFVEFQQGQSAAYHWCVLGSRSGCDLNKIKESEDHFFDDEQDFCTTAFVDGRSKLHLHQSGTRPWNAWVICFCPNHEHVPPPPGFEWEFDDDGNPAQIPEGICTNCPLFGAQLLRRLQPNAPFRWYKKWTQKRFQRENHGSVFVLAMRWFVQQGVMTWENPFDTNSGRKALALWCDELNVLYHESVEIMSDTEDVWRQSYQPNLPPSGYKPREQSQDYLKATAALRRFRTFLGRDPPPEPLPPGMTPTQKHLQMLSEAAGIAHKTRKLYEKKD